MQLNDLADVFNVVGSISAAVIAYLVYQWSRRSHFINAIKEQNNEWQTVNCLVISNDDLLSLERANHPFGDISLQETKKMYFYFLVLNSDYNSWIIMKNRMSDRNLAYARLNNHANMLFNDRHFIERHVFPRGYDEGFCWELRKRWREIEDSGRPLKMPIS